MRTVLWGLVSENPWAAYLEGGGLGLILGGTLGVVADAEWHVIAPLLVGAMAYIGGSLLERRYQSYARGATDE